MQQNGIEVTKYISSLKANRSYYPVELKYWTQLGRTLGKIEECS